MASKGVMPKRGNLKTNFIFNLISQILGLIIPFITSPYISRVLQVEVVGRISYVNSIITYFVLFANLGLNIYGQRQIAKYREDLEEKSKIFWEIITLRMVLTTISLIVFFIIYSAFGFGEKYNLFILISSLQIFAIPFNIQFLYQGEENFKSLAIRDIFFKVISLVFLFAFIKSKEDGWIYVLISSLSSLASALVMWPGAFSYLKKISFKSLDIKKHIKPTIMIFLPTLAVTIYSVLDKSMIGWLAPTPDYANGCYDRAYTINSMALLLVTVINAIMIPRNANEFAKGAMEKVRENVHISFRYVLMIGLPLIAGFLVLSNSLVSWFIGPGFEDVPILLKIMSIRFVVSGFGAIMGEQLFIAIGKEKYPTIATFIAAFVNILLNFILIPYLGAIGAAITTAVSEVLVTSILLVLGLRGKYFSINKVLKLSYKYFIAALIMFVPIFFMNKVMSYTIWNFLIIMIVGILVYGISLLILKDQLVYDVLKVGIGFINKKRNKTKEENNLLNNDTNMTIIEDKEQINEN